MTILILEPGAWGTALGIILSRKNKVSFWYRDKKLAFKISKNRKNEKLTGIKIPEKILISSDLGEVLKNTELIIIASPSFNFRHLLLNLKKYIGQAHVNWPVPLLGIAKGIEKATLKLPSQIAEEIFPSFPYAHLSGPGFASEIIRGKPAEEVIASKNKTLLKKLKVIFKIRPLKILTTTDSIGIQLAGAIKNSLAIGISLAEAAREDSKINKIRQKLIEAGLKEMIKIGKKLKGKKETFLGPAGLGDLILTSSNRLSRNFQFGKNLYLDAEKMRQNIRERKITVEGFDSVWALHKLGKKYKLDLPMVGGIYQVIYQKASPKETIKNLIKMAKVE